MLDIYSHKYPAIHINLDYPFVYDFFRFLLIIFILFFVLHFVFNSFKIIKRWNLIINRNKFFYLFSLYFIIFLVFSIVITPYHKLETNGVKLLYILSMYNFYVINLQIMWRTTLKGEEETKEIFRIAKPVTSENIEFDYAQSFFYFR